jgi:hypothetical protein
MESRKNSYNMTEQEKKKRIRELAAELLPDLTVVFKKTITDIETKRAPKVARLKQLINAVCDNIVGLSVKKNRASKHLDMVMCLAYALKNNTNNAFTLEEIGAAMDRHHSTIIYYLGQAEFNIRMDMNLRKTDIPMAEFTNKINYVLEKELNDKKDN